jgi:hypothetical protein
MKKALLVLTVVVVALSFSQPASALQIDVMFDGYCDGMSLNIIPGTGLVDGARIGCYTEPLHGTVGNVIGQGVGVTVTIDPPGIAGIITVVRQDGTWTHYGNDGSGIYVLNSGTWSNALNAVATDSNVSSFD